jgi:hypothetical protein
MGIAQEIPVSRPSYDTFVRMSFLVGRQMPLRRPDLRPHFIGPGNPDALHPEIDELAGVVQYFADVVFKQDAVVQVSAYDTSAMVPRRLNGKGRSYSFGICLQDDNPAGFATPPGRGYPLKRRHL